MRPFVMLVLVLASCAAPAAVASPSHLPATPRTTSSPVATASPTPRPTPSPVAVTPTATSGASAIPSPTPRPTPAPVQTSTPTASPAARASGEIHYVAIGASDTVGEGSLDPANGSWPSRIAALLPAASTYANLGVSGSLTAQAQRDQLPAAVRERPTVVTIWLAVNDMNALVSPPDHAAALRAIVDGLVQATSARVFVGNVPDLRAVPSYANADKVVLLAQVQAYNAGIAAVAAKHPARVVLVDLFTGSAELTSQMTVSADGFHPSDAGYVLIARRFADAMRGSGIPLRPGP